MTRRRGGWHGNRAGHRAAALKGVRSRAHRRSPQARRIGAPRSGGWKARDARDVFGAASARGRLYGYLPRSRTGVTPVGRVPRWAKKS